MSRLSFVKIRQIFPRPVVLVDKMDHKTIYLNYITSGNVQRAMLPIVMPDDRSAIEAALASLVAGETVEHLQGP
ncbi:hypothetical protein [Desulfofundulus kuznetsovii]|uniref:hypothetical protein n=1 Tax=Desulfofundulus kuznetsovii TaxID=58135 RepID=UPI0002DB6F27